MDDMVQWHSMAKPGFTSRWLLRLQPVCMVAAIALLLWGGYDALLISPPDYQQGETVRIMYIHVPAAYLATMAYGLMAVCSFFYLVWKHPMADVTAQAAAPVGAVFALLTLITGSLWGKPTWGTWWVWDARLTSMLVLFLLYLGYLGIEGSFNHPERERKVAAILALVGAVNLPIIKFSVEWWNTLHQPASLFRMDGPSIAGSMLQPLLVMLGGFTCFFVWMLLLRMRTLLIERRIQRLQSA